MREFFDRNHFLMRRLHSLAGIIPVGGFLVFHLYENFHAWTGGAEAYNEAIRSINSMPLVGVIEIVAIFLPLYFHAIYGIFIAADSRNNVANYGYGRNWAFYLQRVTGVLTLFFVSWHIYHFRFQKLLGRYGAPEGGTSMSGMPTFEIVKNAFANNTIFVLYLIGIVAAVYHLCNGIYTFLITWGITVGPKSQRTSNMISMALFVLISILGIFAAFAFRVM